MKISVAAHIKDRYAKVAPAFPALAFFGGFLWDAVTLGIRIKTSDLYIVMGYLFAASTCLVLIGRNTTFKFSKYLPLIFQFFLGGVFSALVVFYFKSSAQLFSYITVIIIALLLIANEFISSRYTRLTLGLLMTSICSTMFFNFFLPHLFGSLASIWFYLSICISILLMLGLTKLIKEPRGRSWPAYTVQIILLSFFLFNWIPPVPLVQKNMAVCHQLKKVNGIYSAMEEIRPWYLKLIPAKQVVHKAQGAEIYCFSSVFAPRGISTKIFHNWEYFQKTGRKWQSRDKIGFFIKSGRVSGYRGFSFKKNLEPGLWRIKVQTANGRIIGHQKFYIEELEPDKERAMSPVILN